jgi:cytochrome c peroxidase
MCTIKSGIVLIILLSGCSDPTNESAVSHPIEIVIPKNFPAPVYNITSNPVTQEGFELGKMLFYDSRLSRDNTISCGFCHHQQAGFTHHGHDVSHGIGDKLGRRNSLPIQNLIFYRNFFWDGGVHNLDLTPLNAINNKVEMDEEVQNIIAKLQNDAVYKTNFKAAFGSEIITTTNFLQALTQFLSTMISANSRYDLHVRNEASLLTNIELDGMLLFKQHCSGCHAGDLFTDQSFRNNGFSSVSDLARDKGREEITLLAEDRGKFKVPSLRNVEFTAPYMHNGKLPTLESVLNFYTTDVHDTPTLDPVLKINGRLGFDLNFEEKQKIIAFLKTLTDEQFLSDENFSEY